MGGRSTREEAGMVWGLLVGAMLAAGPAPKAQGTAPAGASRTQTAAAPAAAPKAQAPAEAKPKQIRIAVLDVQLTGGGDRKTVEGLSALLASEVARRPALTVVAGSDLRALVGFERQKQLLGCTEGSCLTEIAGALGVSYLVSTEASKVGSTWLLSLALLDAGKAVALKRLTRRAASDDALVDEAVRAVDELLTALPGAGAPGPAQAALPPAPVAAAPAYAPGATPPGFHEHDGFFLQFQVGGGALRSAGGDLTLTGPSGSLSIAAGGTLFRGISLYGIYFADVDSSPTVKLAGGPSGTATNATHSLSGFGAGISMYSASNWFVSAAFTMSRVSLEVGGSTGSTKWGPGFRVNVGKEWWVSPDWGIGVSAQVTGGNSKDDSLAADVGTTGLALCFSATYN
jgi:TolB-like protein